MSTHSLRHRVTHALHRGEEWLFANPKIVLGLIFAATLLFSLALPKLRVYSDFADLLPQNHRYIQVYNRIKESFGGANMIIMAVEVEKGSHLQRRHPQAHPRSHPGRGQPAGRQSQPRGQPHPPHRPQGLSQSRRRLHVRVLLRPPEGPPRASPSSNSSRRTSSATRPSTVCWSPPTSRPPSSRPSSTKPISTTPRPSPNCRR